MSLYKTHNSDVVISYSQTISYRKENIHRMMSEAFRLMELDSEHYKTSEWNPLGGYVYPGDKVLIKPNLVMHSNPSGEGIECLYTQPEVVSTVIEFVLIALKGSGSIIVGDAPMQGCRFDELAKESGYESLIASYQEKGVDIALRDFRNTVSETRNGVVIEKELRRNESVTVDLGGKSCFADLPAERIKNMRVTNYDPQILQEHHSVYRHEYLVAKEVLDADVVINMPKPKTHRKAGVTAALKNLVGINSCKEYLPHHTRQSRDMPGDAFQHQSSFLRWSDDYEDKKCKAEKRYHYKRAMIYRYIGGVCRRIGRLRVREKYCEGSWYGNDTIWRTILDLNKILQYADRNGNICGERQRRFFNIGDMVVSGEKDGPVCPSRKDAGIIIIGEDPCSFDEVVTALMGFDGRKIPTICRMRQAEPQIYFSRKYRIISNNSAWDGKEVADIYKNDSLGFAPNPGWEERLK